MNKMKLNLNKKEKEAMSTGYSFGSAFGFLFTSLMFGIVLIKGWDSILILKGGISFVLLVTITLGIICLIDSIKKRKKFK